MVRKVLEAWPLLLLAVLLTALALLSRFGVIGR